MIEVITTKLQLKQFVSFVKTIYQDDPLYVPPIYRNLTRELKRLILVERTYVGLLYYDQSHVLQGRLLFTFALSKHQNNQMICYFSMFECVNDVNVARSLFQTMEEMMKENKITYAEGTFTPYDPDTRRGILVEGFDSDPVLFTTYNLPYYASLMEQCGYHKAYDTVALTADITEESRLMMIRLSNFVQKHNDIRIDSLDWHHIDKDMEDFHQVMMKANHEMIYQNPPSLQMIRDFVTQQRFFLTADWIKIARVRSTMEPIGVCVVVKDYGPVIRASGGTLNPIRLLRNRKLIKTARGMLQYVVPKYQESGLIGAMFKEVFDTFEPYGITHFEASTIMEENLKSIHVFNHFNGRIYKRYRLYGKELPL